MAQSWEKRRGVQPVSSFNKVIAPPVAADPYSAFVKSLAPNGYKSAKTTASTSVSAPSYIANGGKSVNVPKSTQPTLKQPLKSPLPLVKPSAVAQAINTADGVGFENAMSYEGNGAFDGKQFLGTGNAMSGLGVGTDASYISQLGGYMPQSSAVAQSVMPSGSAPWYSTNAGGFSDEQLASMTPEQLIAAKGLQSNLASNIGLIGSGVSAVSGLYDIYNTYQQNKMMKDAYNTQKSELARQVQKDQAFSSNINKSGLGTRA